MDPARRFDDWHAIQTLVMIYTEFVDAARWAEAAGLFRDATYRHEYGPDRPIKVCRGVQEVQDYMASTPVFPDGTPRTRHTITNLDIRLDGDAATARSYVTVLQQTPTLPLQPVASGHYIDRFERVDGTWRFADRLITGFLVGDISEHSKGLNHEQAVEV
jgi:hypothetical protein